MFTILPTIATIVGLCSFYFGLYWLTLIASIFCLPVIFYRFVVETNFFFTFSILPLTIIGAFVHSSWYGGAALFFHWSVLRANEAQLGYKTKILLALSTWG